MTRLSVYHRRNRGVASEKGKARTEKRRNLPLCDQVEQQRAESGEQQRCRDGKPCQQRHKNRGAEHGKHMLQAQDDHLRPAQTPRVINGALLRSRLECTHFLPPHKNPRISGARHPSPPSGLPYPSSHIRAREKSTTGKKYLPCSAPLCAAVCILPSGMMKLMASSQKPVSTLSGPILLTAGFRVKKKVSRGYCIPGVFPSAPAETPPRLSGLFFSAGSCVPCPCTC